jgi:hypothetical protein
MNPKIGFKELNRVPPIVREHPPPGEYISISELSLPPAINATNSD